MPCEECTTRRKAVESCEATVLAKEFKYQHVPWMTRDRLLTSYNRDLDQARENLRHHESRCEEASK